MITEIMKYGELISAIVGVFSIIATVTPTKIDNKIVGYIAKVINLFGMNFGKAKNDTVA